MEGEVKRDRWGYEVNTSSDACISAINSYYLQVSLTLLYIYYSCCFHWVVRILVWKILEWNEGSGLRKKAIGDSWSAGPRPQLRIGQYIGCKFPLLLQSFSCSFLSPCCKHQTSNSLSLSLSSLLFPSFAYWNVFVSTKIIFLWRILLRGSKPVWMELRSACCHNLTAFILP